MLWDLSPDPTASGRERCPRVSRTPRGASDCTTGSFRESARSRGMTGGHVTQRSRICPQIPPAAAWSEATGSVRAPAHHQ